MMWKRLILASILPAALSAGALVRGAGAQNKPTPATGAIAGQVAIHGQGSAQTASNVVVYLSSSPKLDPRTHKTTRTITQSDLRFSPSLVVIPQGGTVAFPNNDRVFHNVFSLSSTRRFDLGLYRDGDSRSVTFQRPGVVDVYCNIHPDMKAKIKVVPNSFYTRVNKHGRFRIAKVPVGSYTLVAWNGNEASAPVHVRAGQTTNLRLELAPASSSKRHLRKDGTPYRRYR